MKTRQPREIIPEFFINTDFFYNYNCNYFGIKNTGELVDNLSFKLHRSNGIWIKSFYGDCVTHRNKILSVILEKVRFVAEETNDIRDILRKEQHLIINKITSNL